MSVSDHSSAPLEGLLAQALGRDLMPRLSTGTLQLSMRCSSVHFGPSRSLPVSTGTAVAPPRACRPSSAAAQDSNAISSNAQAIPRRNLMRASSNVVF